MRRTRLVVVAGALAASGALVACSSSEAPARVLTAAEVAAVMRGAEANNTFLHDAEQQLILRCMKRAGFPYEMVPAPGGLPDPFRGTRLSSATAAREGYGVRRSTESKPPRDFALDYAARLPTNEAERFMAALHGNEDQTVTVEVDGGSISTNRDGCTSGARIAVYGDLAKYTKLSYIAHNVRGEASRNIDSDPAYVETQKAWAECMASAGYPFPSRRKARDEIVKRYQAAGADRDAVFRGEVATAKADAACSARTGFDRVLAETQERATAAAVSRYEGDLIAFRELNAESVGRAKRALASS